MNARGAIGDFDPSRRDTVVWFTPNLIAALLTEPVRTTSRKK